jgi:hypothetical protein
MAEANDPKKETTRIPMAPPVAGKPPEPSAKSRDTVRIQLPIRDPSVGVSTEPQFFQPPPQSPAVPVAASVMPAPDLPSSAPKKETVRIPSSAVQKKETQPLVAMPETTPQNPSIAVAPVEKNPMQLLWLLLGVSAVLLIIQIWTYFS